MAGMACILGILFIGSVGIALSQEKPVIVNLMIAADITPSPTHQQLLTADSSLRNLTTLADSSGLNLTVFVSGNMASEDRLGVTSQGSLPNHELAMHGNMMNEKLSSMPYDSQLSTLKGANGSLSICYICGQTHLAVKGFMPQAFDQNNDTFKVLEKLGIVYDAGFQTGLIYRSGHENDTWPYPIEGYILTAVPVSAYTVSGERLYLDDRYIRDGKKFSSSQWYELLVKKFDESAKTGDPMVAVFHNLVSGTSDYLDAYKKFLNYATSKKAKFVTTMQLVEMAAAKGANLPSVQPLNASKSKYCPACIAEAQAVKPAINVSVKKNPSCPTCGQNKTNSTKKN
jgi:hypothetical protein